MIGPIFRHLLMTLRLNFRSRQAIIYGYVIPVFFLFAFAAIFRWDSPPLLGQMGQLVTVTVLGGACFGMPTALVAERERGIWRRYRLLPAPLVGLVGSTLIARYVIVGSAVLMQIGVAWLFYRTPMPVHPGRLLVAFTIVAAAFEGIGLVVAAIADTVPAVQALGQMLFLPMIMVGGVGVPLSQLPHWAQNVAGFFPGRYAVELMQPCFDGSPAGGWAAVGYAGALGVIAAGGFVAGGLLFRWESSQRATARSYALAAAAAVPWVVVGIVAMSASHTDRTQRTASIKSQAVPPFTRPRPTPTSVGSITTSAPVQPWELVTDDQIRAITFEGLPDDSGNIAPVAPSASDISSPQDKAWIDDFRQKLDVWEPGQVGSPGDRVRRMLAVASIADLMELGQVEGMVARAVFDRLQADFSPQELVPILAWVVLKPDEGAIVTDISGLDLAGKANPSAVRHRSQIYALKLLGRLLGKLPDIAPEPK
jgi:ABC-type transport system involved in cytochrome c biogenesis permease component